MLPHAANGFPRKTPTNRQQTARIDFLDTVKKYQMDVLVGGGKSAMVRRNIRQAPEITVVADTREDLEKTRAKSPPGSEIRFFSLGDRNTGDTLFRDAPQHVQFVIANCGHVIAAEGLGQVRGIGAQCARRLAAGYEFQKFAEALRDKILIDTGGAPEAIGATLHLGSGGGTGGGASKELERALVIAIEPLKIPIEVKYDVLDFVTFSGFGPNIILNSAATLAELLELLITKGGNRLALVTRSVHLTSLPPFLHRSELRSRYILLDQQAMASREMDAFLRPEAPNHAIFLGPYGNIIIRQIEFFHVPHPETEIAAGIAQRYFSALSAGIGMVKAEPELVEELAPVASKRPLHRESLDRLLVSGQRPIEDIIAAVTAPDAVTEYAVSAHIVTGKEWELADLDKYFVHPPATLTKALADFALLLSIQHSLSEGIAEVREEEEELVTRFERLKKLVRNRLKAITGWTLFRQSAAKNLVLAMQSLRDTSDQLLDTVAWRVCLERAATTCARLIEEHESRLARIAEALDDLRPKGSMQHDEKLVIERSIDDAFPDLLKLPAVSREIQFDIVAGQVELVTKAGLARITGSETEDLATIADIIAFGEPALRAPFLGGSPPTQAGQLVIALPPMEKYVTDALRALLETRLPKESRVIVCDLASSGVSILRYRFRYPQKLQDVFPGSLWQALHDAARSPLRDLFFEDVNRTFRVLGIPVPEGEVTPPPGELVAERV